MGTEVIIPQLGESITEATVGQWLKSPGDAVNADEPIVSLETDKVAVEVPSPVSGTMGEQLAKVGDTVNVGSTIARIEGAAGAPVKAAAPTPAVVKDKGAAQETPPDSMASDEQKAVEAKPAAAGKPERAPPAPTPPVSGRGEDYDGMAPSVRRLLADHDIDAKSVTGTGLDGRLTKGDVLAAIDAGTAKVRAPEQLAQADGTGTAPNQNAPTVPPPASGRGEERVRMTRLRQTIARRLKEAQNTAAMLTTFNDVDMSAVMAARSKYKDAFEKKHNVRLGFMSFFTQACVAALRDVPSVNASIEGDEVVYRNYADIGIAVSSPGGLVVPILRDADKLDFAATEKAIGDFGRRAQAGQLKIDELQGGTFTITNGGVFGSLMSTPIINPPQSAVLGMHRIEERPVVRDGQVVARPMMYLALSYDHRLIDGREAVTFLVAVKNAIEDPTRLLVGL